MSQTNLPSEKITEAEYVQLLTEIPLDEEKIKYYSLVIQGEGGFSWQLVPNPERVERSLFKSFPGIGATANDLWRRARALDFSLRLPDNQLPVLVSEGDSWFQFPLFIRETIDQLRDDYLIYSLGAAGDTVENMIFNRLARGKTEYLIALKEYESIVQGFLFSGAGNDIIGEDPATQESALYDLLRNYDTVNSNNPHDYIDWSKFGERLSELRRGYQTLIQHIRAEPVFQELPIFFHGYDYVFPYPWNEDGEDTRRPIYILNTPGRWLGTPMSERNYPTDAFRREILKVLIDTLYQMLESVAANDPMVHVIDCRGAMPKVSDWNDEIHGNHVGFAKVAAKFRQKINSVL